MKVFLLTIIVLTCFISCKFSPDCTVQNYRWTEQEAMEWYDSLGWIKGFNYVPSYIANTTEWWENELDTAIINRELKWAEKLGYTSTRIFIQYIVWKNDPDVLKSKFTQFLELAAKCGISVMPVLFDDCAFGDPVQLDPYLGVQREVIPGMILSNWTPSPGITLGRDSSEHVNLKKYVQDMLASFREDKRIILWDLFNEPSNRAEVGTPDFIVRLFSWAREVNPSQPLSIAVWYPPDDHPLNIVLLAYSDVITFHLYSDDNGMNERIQGLKKYNRPILCTEWMARSMGSNFATDLPLFKSENIAAYQWGLVNGRTQCQYPWWNKPGGEVDTNIGWFHDILYPDGKPYREDEINIIMKY